MTGIGTAINSTKILDELEKTGLVAMDDAAGDFLAAAGTADMAALTEEQRIDLWKAVMLAFGDSIRDQVRSGKAPF